MAGLSLALAVLLTSPVAPTPTAEWLAPADLDRLDVAEAGQTVRTARTVFVGRGETAANWTRRITIWRAFEDRPDPAAFPAWLEGLRRDIVADCPGVTATPLTMADWNGRPAGDFGITCPLYPGTGRPDIYFVRTISVETGWLAAAVTFRRAPAPAELDAARAYLATLVLCTRASPEPVCRQVPDQAPLPPRTVTGTR